MTKEKVLIGLLVAGVLVYVYVKGRKPYVPENPTYPNGLKSVSLEDEYKHNVPLGGEMWAPVYCFKTLNGVAWKWGGNFESDKIESISMLDSETIRIYGSGVEFILQPTKGYRKTTIDINFLDSPLKDYIGWKTAQVGDVAEFQSYAPKAVFWQNRGEPLTIGGLKNFMHYQALGTVTLSRNGQSFNGVGSFQRAWADAGYYPSKRDKWAIFIIREDAFHIYTENFILFIQASVTNIMEIRDGMVYWLDDGSYDVLGESVKGYPYKIIDGSYRLSYHISSETHKGTVEIDISESRDAQPTVKGFQQASWSSVRATLDGEIVQGTIATTETVR